MEENKDIKYRIANLLSIKSLVTLVLTCAFAYLSVTEYVGSDEFVKTFTIIIVFYFGTQSGNSGEI